MTCVTRWHESMPQYHVGHKRRIKESRESLASAYPGVYMTGASLKVSVFLTALIKEKPPCLTRLPIYSVKNLRCMAEVFIVQWQY